MKNSGNDHLPCIFLFKENNSGFFINGVSVSEQSEECFGPLCEEPPSIMQWLYRHLSGHQVRQMKVFTWKKFERTFLTPPEISATTVN